MMEYSAKRLLKNIGEKISSLTTTQENWMAMTLEDSFESVKCGEENTFDECFGCKKNLDSLKTEVCKYCSDKGCHSSVCYKITIKDSQEKQRICYSCVLQLKNYKPNDASAKSHTSSEEINTVASPAPRRRPVLERPPPKPFRTTSSQISDREGANSKSSDSFMPPFKRNSLHKKILATG
jgi:hypothetical protein